MEMRLSKSFKKQLANRIERFEFEVGILDDKEHYEPKDQKYGEPPDTRTYAGGPTRKQSRVKSGKTTGEILVDNMQRLGINLLWEPFTRTDSDIMKFTREFLKMAVSDKNSTNRVRNLLQAIVRNPILKQEYGPNSSGTADAKGFDRHLFDTGQMFKAIKARVKRVIK